jgi:SAM-dependent methyltransferase
VCNSACLSFGLQQLTQDDVLDKTIIEVGARDVNGSLRGGLERLGPRSYHGVDIEMGPGVDAVCDITELVDRYGTESFDVVISTEVMEHVREWRSAISNLKRLVKPNGVLLITTRSKGFPYHGYPYDFWRYEVSDMRTIFSDMSIDVIDTDPLSPGVFIKAHRPVPFVERELDSIDLYSIITHQRSHDVTDGQVYLRRLRHKVRRVLAGILPKPLLRTLDRLVTGG